MFPTVSVTVCWQTDFAVLFSLSTSQLYVRQISYASYSRCLVMSRDPRLLFFGLCLHEHGQWRHLDLANRRLFQLLVRLTLRIVVLHILQIFEFGPCYDRVALISLVGYSLVGLDVEDVGFAVLFVVYEL